MRNRFLQFIKKHALNDADGKILLAISGGVDSMFLWHLVEETNIDYAIAHCNFQLRGEDADGDEAFVLKEAGRLGVVCHTKSFDTKSYATINKISTQMAARDLRYTWFNELVIDEGYEQVYLAHHANDDIETVLLNLVRGTSIKGLSGISPIREKMVRPLLDITKKEILAYAGDNGIEWREDISNAKSDYKRNFIRNEVIPKLESLNPEFLKTMKRNMVKNDEVAQIAEAAIEKMKGDLLNREEEVYMIAKADLRKLKVGPYVLSEVLKDFGFNYHQSEEVLAGLGGLSGKTYGSASHELLIDRDHVVIRPSKSDFDLVQQVQLGDSICTDLFEYSMKKLEDILPEIDRSVANAMLDLDKLNFPLFLRKWRIGDKFQPLGMKGQKLVSDFLIDLKLSVFEKDNVYVLCSGDKIAWVIGYRISDDFKREKGTTSVLHCQLLDSNQ